MCFSLEYQGDGMSDELQGGTTTEKKGETSNEKNMEDVVIPAVQPEREAAESAVKPDEAEKPKKTRKKKTAKDFAISFFIKVGITVLCLWILLTWVVGVYVNHSNSSYPMLKDGDLCITFRLANLNTGDEIAYERDGQIYFGRIVALPGDTVEISDGSLTVNGYGAFEDAVYPTTDEGSKITYPYKVPEDTVFVLNDYRSDATDSRTYGAIPKSDTKGCVVFVMRRRGI